ncbi:MAG: DUF1595 domain-containing protein, partial [Bacteroidota bacterium]
MLPRGRFPVLLGFFSIVAGAVGCAGDVTSPGISIGGSGAAGGGSSGTGGNGGSVGGGGAGASGSGGNVGIISPLLPARIRRMTNAEYDASVKALFGTSMTMSATFPPDSRQGIFARGGYTVNDAQRVDPVLGKQLSDAASAVVAEARQNGRLANFSPCTNAATGGEACAKTFIQSFGAKAYRRPLADDEVTAFLAVYRVGAMGATYNDGIDLVTRATLQSAGFVYLT